MRSDASGDETRFGKGGNIRISAIEARIVISWDRASLHRLDVKKWVAVTEKLAGHAASGDG